MVQLLIESGVDVNKKDIGRFTTLHCASLKGFSNIIALLIKHAANVNFL